MTSLYHYGYDYVYMLTWRNCRCLCRFRILQTIEWQWTLFHCQITYIKHTLFLPFIQYCSPTFENSMCEFDQNISTYTWKRSGDPKVYIPRPLTLANNDNLKIDRQIYHHEREKLPHRFPSGLKTMMTSSNGNIFRVTDPLCGEFTGPGEFPTQRPVTRSFDIFFDLRLNKWLSKQPWGWWFETPSWSLWRHCNALVALMLAATNASYKGKVIQYICSAYPITSYTYPSWSFQWHWGNRTLK